MDDNLVRATRNQSRKTFSDVWRFDFEKGGFNQGEAASLANETRGTVYVFIGLSSAAAMADD